MSIIDIKSINIQKAPVQGYFGTIRRLNISSKYTTSLVDVSDTVIEVNTSENPPHQYIAVKKIVIGGAAGTGEAPSIDIGSGPSQIPTNSIVKNTLDGYLILSKQPGNEDADIPDNDRVKSLISAQTSPISNAITTLNSEVQNIKDNPPASKPEHHLICSENIPEGKYINIWVDEGVSKIRLANASNGRLVDGYVEASFVSGTLATFYKVGENSKGNVCPHGKLFLSPTNPGDATTVKPADRSGDWYQEIGTCIGDGIHIFQLGFTIQLT